jgi:myo-inositol-1(or 4)-monophosphatase
MTSSSVNVPGAGLSETAASALDIAREAAELVMRILPEPRVGKDVRHKSPQELVTRADHEAERLITSRIKAGFPGHAIVGEEGQARDAASAPRATSGATSGGAVGAAIRTVAGEYAGPAAPREARWDVRRRGCLVAGESAEPAAPKAGAGPPAPADAAAQQGPRWFVDPVDGTANFAHGVPWFAISMALEDGGAIQCGVVAVPPLREFFVAERGRGAFQVGDGGVLIRLATSATADLGTALVATGLPREPARGAHVPTIAPMMMRALEVRIMGAAAIHLAYVAAGRLDAFWESDLSPWDLAAGILMVEEAGGRVTDWSGRPLRALGGRLLASNGPLHGALVDVLGPWSVPGDR